MQSTAIVRELLFTKQGEQALLHLIIRNVFWPNHLFPTQLAVQEAAELLTTITFRLTDLSLQR